jgi:hypothetical protein
MIATAAHSLQPLKALLVDAARLDDDAPLAECLSGRHLPALGGDQDPAEVVYQALALPPVDLDLVQGVTRAVAALCHAQAATFRQTLEQTPAASATRERAVPPSGGEPSLHEESYLFNLLLFASLVPTNAELFAALQELLAAGRRPAAFTTGMDRTARQLRQALTVHQVDETLQGFWFDLIGRPEPSNRLASDRKADLLDAWAGLLWMPPGEEDRAAGRIPPLDRIAQGLLSLHKVAGETRDGWPILRYALRQLDEAYPRSPEFWAEGLGLRLPGWPQLLRFVVAHQWPRLGGG